MKVILDTKFRWEFFSEFVFIALLLSRVVGGNESKGRGLASRPFIGQRANFTRERAPESTLGQTLISRQKKDQTKVIETLNQCQLFIKGSFRRGRKISKIRYNYGRKMIWPQFFIIFSGLFIQIQIASTLTADRFCVLIDTRK